MSRRYDPTDIHEIDKLASDRIIQEYWNRPETMSFETFFFSEYLLDEFTKKRTHIHGHQWRHTISDALFNSR